MAAESGERSWVSAQSLLPFPTPDTAGTLRIPSEPPAWEDGLEMLVGNPRKSEKKGFWQRSPLWIPTRPLPSESQKDLFRIQAPASIGGADWAELGVSQPTSPLELRIGSPRPLRAVIHWRHTRPRPSSALGYREGPNACPRRDVHTHLPLSAHVMRRPASLSGPQCPFL